MSVLVGQPGPELVSELRKLVEASDVTAHDRTVPERQRTFVTAVTAWLMAAVALLTAAVLGVGAVVPGVQALMNALTSQLPG